MGAIAAGVSATSPLSGQNNRSGPNFTFLSNDGTSITISSPAGVTFNIMQDVSGGSDPVTVKGAANGTQVPGDTFSTKNNYYIANPSHATQSFAVVLNQQ